MGRLTGCWFAWPGGPRRRVAGGMRWLAPDDLCGIRPAGGPLFVGGTPARRSVPCSRAPGNTSWNMFRKLEHVDYGCRVWPAWVERMLACVRLTLELCFLAGGRAHPLPRSSRTLPSTTPPAHRVLRPRLPPRARHADWSVSAPAPRWPTANRSPCCAQSRRAEPMTTSTCSVGRSCWPRRVASRGTAPRPACRGHEKRGVVVDTGALHRAPRLFTLSPRQRLPRQR